LIEAHLGLGEIAAGASELQKVTAEPGYSDADLALAGQVQRLEGLYAAERGDAIQAAHHFGRSASIFDLLGDRYRSALAQYELGRAYSADLPDRARDSLSLAAGIFRQLGARFDLARAEDALRSLASVSARQQGELPELSPLPVMRLCEAVASRELLLRELATVIHQETDARRVVMLEPAEEGRLRVVAAQGCAATESARIAAALSDAATESEGEQFSLAEDAAIVRLRVVNAKPATLFISPRSATTSATGRSIDALLRVAEMGVELCATRTRPRPLGEHKGQSALTDQSVMPGFIHSSPAMASLIDEIQKIRSSDAVHTFSSHRSKVFLPFNCTAVPKELSEGYLFGYRKGAFTGAVADSPGVIRSAAGGTLFLDEVGDLPIDLQPKLLRFLQEGEIQPLGEQRPVKVDVRIIAATNTDLEKMVEEGRFREDLYYRLNVIRLRVPPLRERRSEVSALVEHYINHYSAKFGRSNIRISPQAVDLLMVSDWPGNVRQLCNEIQRVVARAEDGLTITPNHLSPELRRVPTPGGTASAVALNNQPSTISAAVEELERAMIIEALRKHSGNVSRAARELGLTRRGLQLKLRRYSLSSGA
jgi:transcriptional regulator of acetoin/glycerol metabolism